MVQGKLALDPEVVGLLYREKFGLTWEQLQREPADQVGLWMALEEARAEEEKRLSKQHR